MCLAKARMDQIKDDMTEALYAFPIGQFGKHAP